MHDGYRDGKSVRLWTRNGHDWSDRFPLISEAALRNRNSSFVLDGEAVLLGVDGRSDFNGLHSRKHDDEVQFYAFDALVSDGQDLRRLPLSMRKASLARLLVVHHSGFDVLIPSHSRMGKFSGGKRISMLRGTPGWRRIKPFRSRVTIIWWTDGGLTRKWRWMSASAGGCPNM
jgi:hypothetical protein